MDWFKNLFVKHNKPVNQVYYHTLGEPRWSPRSYESRCIEGYSRNVIVYRCITLIAKSIATVPWLVYKGDKELDTHPLVSMIKRPNDETPWAGFIEEVISNLLISGNSYIEILETDQPHQLYSLRPDKIKVLTNDSGYVSAYQYTVGSKARIIEKMIHLKRFNPLDYWYGMSPIDAAASAIDQYNAVSAHNLSLLQNGGRPSGALLVKNNSMRLTDEQREQLQYQLKKAYEGTSSAGKIMVLEGDVEWKEMGLSLKDLDFIEGKNLAAREIAQVFGVPPLLAGVPGDATYANYKEARLHFWEDTIIPILEYLSTELNHHLAHRFGEDIEICYDVDAIPALALKREAVWGKLEETNFLTINEKRQAIGYSPLKGGDSFNIQGKS